MIQKKKKNAKKNIMYNMVRENYLLYKIRVYEKDPETCLKDYKTSCFNFLNVIIEKTFEFIKVNFSENENFWKWKNISKKTFPNKPFSMIPGFNVLAHRVISTDVNKFFIKKIREIQEHQKFHIVELMEIMMEMFLQILNYLLPRNIKK